MGVDLRTRPDGARRTGPAGLSTGTQPRPQAVQEPSVPAPQWVPAKPARSASTRRVGAPRLPFVLLLLALLGGGLICLLVINTTLATASFRISDLRAQDARLTQREQQLQQQVSAEYAPTSIAARAERLGMRPVRVLHFLDPRTGRIYTQPLTLPGVAPVPGYTP